MTRPPAPHPATPAARSSSGHEGASAAATRPTQKTSAQSMSRRPTPRRERVKPIVAMPTHSPRKYAVTIRPAVLPLIWKREAMWGSDGP